MNGGGRRYPRWAMLMVALLLPAVSLLPFGSLWLWQHGVILYWAIATCVMVVAVYYFEQKLIDPVAAPAAPDQIDPAPPEAGWSPRQAAAWEDVARLANQVSPERMTSREAVLGLGLEAIEGVAKRLDPERRGPPCGGSLPGGVGGVGKARPQHARFSR